MRRERIYPLQNEDIFNFHHKMFGNFEYFTIDTFDTIVLRLYSNNNTTAYDPVPSITRNREKVFFQRKIRNVNGIHQTRFSILDAG